MTQLQKYHINNYVFTYVDEHYLKWETVKRYLISKISRLRYMYIRIRHLLICIHH